MVPQWILFCFYLSALPCHPRRLLPHPFYVLGQREINYKLLADGISTRGTKEGRKEGEKNVGFPRSSPPLPLNAADEICLLAAAEKNYMDPDEPKVREIKHITHIYLNSEHTAILQNLFFGA